jgi:hypothetical protein
MRIKVIKLNNVSNVRIACGLSIHSLFDFHQTTY